MALPKDSNQPGVFITWESMPNTDNSRNIRKKSKSFLVVPNWTRRSCLKKKHRWKLSWDCSFNLCSGLHGVSNPCNRTSWKTLYIYVAVVSGTVLFLVLTFIIFSFQYSVVPREFDHSVWSFFLFTICFALQFQ